MMKQNYFFTIFEEEKEKLYRDAIELSGIENLKILDEGYYKDKKIYPGFKAMIDVSGEENRDLSKFWNAYYELGGK